MLTPDRFDRLMVEIERGQQLAGHYPNPRALARARRILTGELSYEDAIAEIEFELDIIQRIQRFPREMLTSAELAELISLTAGRLAYWRRASLGPPYSRAGHRIRYERSAVIGWLMRR